MGHDTKAHTIETCKHLDALLKDDIKELSPYLCYTFGPNNSVRYTSGPNNLTPSRVLHMNSQRVSITPLPFPLCLEKGGIPTVYTPPKKKKNTHTPRDAKKDEIGYEF